MDTLMPPFTPSELVIAYSSGGATRGVAVGIAVGLAELRSCLGVINDGLLTVQPPSSIFSDFELPLSDASQTAANLGAAAVSLMVTVPKVEGSA